MRDALRVLLAVSVLALTGCARRPSSEQALAVALKDVGQTKSSVYPLAGKVTIDGRAPAYDQRTPIFVILVDPSKLKPLEYVECDEEGHFAFHTYAAADGVRPGTYIVAFARFKTSRRAKEGSDLLNNLYNDPEKNAVRSEFKIEHADPGKSDYLFDLKLAGLDPATPGPKAITHL